MRLNRLFLDQPLIPGTALSIAQGPARHLAQVLRLAVGAPLVVFNGDGHDYGAHVSESNKSGVILMIETPGEREPDPPIEIELALGISKGDRMDYAVQKSVELGVGKITPLFSERSMVQLSGVRLTRRLAHWNGVIIGACEQSGRRRLPRLETATPFADWISQAPVNGLMLDPQATDALASLPRPSGPLTLVVGPEGGLSPKERALATRHGFRGVRLGPRILRTETAPLAAITVIQALWGDFQNADDP